MPRFRLAILLLLLSPSLAGAQPAAVAPSDPAGWRLEAATAAPNKVFRQADPARPVMPLWSTTDGRILAIVALGSANPAIPALAPAPRVGSAADWMLIDVTDVVDFGLSLRVADTTHTYARLSGGLTPTQRLFLPAGGPLCSGSPLLADGRCAADNPIGRTATVRLGAALNAGAFDFDLNYGLSWLRANEPLHPNSFVGRDPMPLLGFAEGGLPNFLVPGLALANLQNSAISASGRWRFAEDQSLDLGASFGRIQIELPGTEPLPYLNQAALRFGLRHGDFSGVIVGRVIGSGEFGSGQRWSTIDLGISWRAPWRGVFSVGAQNLWSSGSPGPLDTNAREADPALSRVPYVQYHQDL
jgi:hypothetical protein